MNITPKVSVIVPAYKVEKYLRRCVETIRNQILEDIEIILVDDGSPDDCSHICDEYALIDQRIKVVHKANGGVSSARNVGLQIALGEYIGFVDSDDYINRNMYYEMYDVAKTFECDLVIADCIKEYPDKSEPYTHPIREGYYNRSQLVDEYFPHLLIMEEIEYPATISNWVCLFKNNKRNKRLRYIEGVRYSEDWLFGSQLAYNANSMYYMKMRCFYHYLMNPNSASHSSDLTIWHDYMTMYNGMEEYFLNSKEYDFRSQLRMVMLFLVYSSIGRITSAKDICFVEKYKASSKILNSKTVKNAFKNITIKNLEVSQKQKMITYCYKYKILIPIIIRGGLK